MVTKQNKISRKIIDKLRLKKEKVLSKKEIVEVIKEHQKIYKKKLNFVSLWTYLRKDSYIKRIIGDYYYLFSLDERYNSYCQFSEEELIFLVLEKMKIRWYLGLENALKENKINWQVFNITTIINEKFSGLKKLGNSQFRFIKTKKEKFNFGLIKKRTGNNVRYFYSDMEKTYLDFLYFYSYEGKDIKIVEENLDFKVKKNKLRQYAKNYSKKIQRFTDGI